MKRGCVEKYKVETALIGGALSVEMRGGGGTHSILVSREYAGYETHKWQRILFVFQPR